MAEGNSFRPLWKPPFIDRLAPEDCCHLNGLAMEAEQPRHVTCVSPSDVMDGWRDPRRGGGLVIDAALRAREVDARTGLLGIDTRTGAVVEWVRIEGVIDELFDVAFLQGIRNPKAIRIKESEIKRMISVGPAIEQPSPQVL